MSGRLCDFALGTDTGGSVRTPASHCGLYGLRPTHGRISLLGAMDLSPSFDTCCWFARDVSTFARVANVLLGEDTTPLPSAPRLLAPTEVWGLLAPEVTEALAPARARIEALFGAAAPAAVVLDSFDAMYWHFRQLQGREARQVDGPLIQRYQPPFERSSVPGWPRCWASPATARPARLKAGPRVAVPHLPTSRTHSPITEQRCRRRVERARPLSFGFVHCLGLSRRPEADDSSGEPIDGKRPFFGDVTCSAAAHGFDWTLTLCKPIPAAMSEPVLRTAHGQRRRGRSRLAQA